MFIGIMGTPTSSGNRGVLALGAALVRLCLDAAPDVQPVLLTSDRHADRVPMRPHGRTIQVPLVRWRLSLRAAWRENLLAIFGLSLLYRAIPPLRRTIAARVPWIRTVETCTLVGDVRGGDSFSDIYGMKRFLIATLPVLSVIAIKGRIVQFPQTYGPYKSSLARAIARFILRRSSTIVARDRESQRVAQELVGPGQSVLLSPDVAFALHASRPEPLALHPPGSAAAPGRWVGLNVNGLMFNGGYTRQNMFGLQLDYPTFVAELLRALLAAQPHDVVLVPHTIAPEGDTESDNAASAKLRATLPPELQARVRIVTGDYDAHELKGIIGTCDFFVGSRMHSCIAALSQGVPCVGVAYSMKFRGVFDSVDMGDWVVDARHLSNADAVARVLALHAQRDGKRAGLAAAAAASRTKLHEVFSRLVRDEHARRTA